MRKSSLLVTMCLAILLLSAAGPLFSQNSLSELDLISELRKGGYIIYFRHAATDWSQQDRLEKAGDWLSCDPLKMRQLSDQGRDESRRIGEHIRGLGIPVGEILTSEYCRARETARYMELGDVTPTPMLMNMLATDFVGGRDQVIERARKVFGSRPALGTNTILVAHGNLLRAAAGTYTSEAGAVVFKPLGNSRFELIAHVSKDDWAKLSRLME